MVKPNHAAEVQAEKTRKPEIAKPVVQPSPLEAAGIDPAMLYSGGTVEAQVNTLNHLQSVQRQAAVEHINQTQGNRHVQTVVSVMTAPAEKQQEAAPAAQAETKTAKTETAGTDAKAASGAAAPRKGGMAGKPGMNLLQEISGLPPLPENLTNQGQAGAGEKEGAKPAAAEKTGAKPATAEKPGAASEKAGAKPAAAAEKAGAKPAPTAKPAGAAPQAAKPAAPAAKPTVKPAAPASQPAASPAAHAAAVQTKLSVSQPGDPYEVEADRVADEVMRMPGRATPPEDPNDNENHNNVGGEISPIQRKGAGAPQTSEKTETQIQQMRGGGQPMPDSERDFFEPRMGVDLSGVRVHTGGDAIQLSRDLQARAFTIGSDVAFNSGEYQPGTPEGRRLMAHELTHVVQQGGAGQLSRKSKNGKNIQRTAFDAIQRLPMIQREGEAGTTSPTPTPEEKAAADAAAARAEAIAAAARQQGQTAIGQSRADQTEAQTAGEAPRQEAAASQAQGPVQETEKAALQAEVVSKAAASFTAALTAHTAAAQNAVAAATQSVQAAAAQATEKAATQAAAAQGAQVLAQQAAAAGGGGGGGGGAADAATAAAKAAVQKAYDSATAAGAQDPKSAEEDPGYQTTKSAAESTAQEQQTHEEAQGKADAAQAAVESPASELESQAQSNQVNEMEGAPTPDFDAAAFKAQLMERIAALAPSTSEQADNFKEGGALNGLKGEMQGTVKTNQDASVGPIKEAESATPDASSVTPKPVTPLTPEEAGAEPAAIGAENAVPKVKGQEQVETPLQESSAALDQQMADAEITEEQLQKSNEPAFTGALEAKTGAQTDAAAAAPAYRAQEQSQIAGAETEAVAAAQASMAEMHGMRVDQFTQVQGRQDQTKTEDEQARVKIATDIQTIYTETKTEVEGILSGLDTKVNQIFDDGAAAAKTAFENYVDAKMDAYKEKRYGGMFGWAQWIADKVMGMPSEVNAFYTEGRQLYIDKMDAVIDNVVAVIGTTLAEAKAAIAKGKQKIQDYVNQLPQNLREVGQNAANEIQSKFDELTQSVDAKQGELIDTLANKYNENLQAIDAQIEEMKAANKGLVDAAMEAIGGVIKTILELKDMLLSVLARAADAVMLILKDPIGFLGNLIQGIKQGFLNFVANIGTHLKNGFMEWLFGAVAETGIQLPKQFDLQGILDLVLQVLGITWANIRSRAVKILGEPVVGALEKAFEMFKIIQEKGLGGLWEYIKEQLGNLQTMVVDGIKDMVITQIIQAGIQWLIGILGGPAGAFIKAAKAIYDVVMWFVNNASKIMGLINAIIDSVTAIANGDLSGAAKYVEDSLAKMIPIAIGFLANLLGLGKITDKIKDIIKKIQAPINKAIDWVLTKAKEYAKKFAKMLGLGKNEKDEKDDKDKDDPRVKPGLEALYAEEKARATEGGINQKEANEIAQNVKTKHPVFASITPIEGASSWDYEYTVQRAKASGKEPKEGGKPYNSKLNSKGNITGNFADFDWSGYPTQATAHPANLKYKNAGNGSVPQPTGTYELAGDETGGSVHTDAWRTLITDKKNTYKTKLQGIESKNAGDENKTRNALLQEIKPASNSGWDQKSIPQVIEDGSKYMVEKDYNNMTYEDIYLVDWQEHHVKPVSFSGSPTSAKNLIFLRATEHYPITGWWNSRMSTLKQAFNK